MRMQLSLLGAIAACTLSSPVTASPSTWSPELISSTMSATCGLLQASISYSLVPGAESNQAFEITDLTVVRADRDRTSLAISEVPVKVDEIDRPFVQRVIPICSERGKFSFVFYIASERDIVLPTYASRGEVTRLYVDISSENRVEMYARSAS